MEKIRVKDTIDHRYLGALRMIDRVTGIAVKRPIRVKAPNLEFFSNRSFLQIISHAVGLEKHPEAFEAPPNEPAIGSLEVTVSVEDPSGEYLSRAATFNLPLVAATREQNNLFDPIDIKMFSSPAARVGSNWSIIRASIYNLSDMRAEEPIPGALLRVVDADDQLLMSGLSDKRGEAAVLIPGIPITTFSKGPQPNGNSDTDSGDEGEHPGTGAVIETVTPATLEIIVRPKRSWPVDPNELEARRSEWRRKFREAGNDTMRDGLALELETGKTQSVKLYVDLT